MSLFKSPKKREIKTSDITDRHPQKIFSGTDYDYAMLANKIYDCIYTGMTVFGNDTTFNVAIGMALYFEDIKSGTHQFEVFTKLYKEWFGLYVPFHASEDATSPDAELDAVNFVLWHSIVAEREGKMANPLNEGIRDTAKEILKLWHDEMDNIPANDVLCGHLFSEETQNNPVDVRDILSWIENRSFLGRWHTNVNRLKEDEHNVVKIYFKDTTSSEKLYEIDCIDAFVHRAWPLSLPASRIYAEMIRMEMEDPKDKYAADIEKMQFEPLGIFRIKNTDNMGYTLIDFKKDTFHCPCTSKEKIKIAKDCNAVICSLYSFRGEWFINGLSKWTKISANKYNTYAEDEMNNYSLMHNHTNILDEAIKKNGGEPIFFFKNFKEYLKWTKKEFEILPDYSMVDSLSPIVGFVETNGHMTLSTTAKYIKHPRNPYYNVNSVKEEPLSLIDKNSLSPGLSMYIIENNLSPDSALSDMRGEEHGRLLLHENMDFLVRCNRRDIDSTKIFHRRDKNLFLSDTDPRKATNDGEMTIQEFVSKVKKQDYFRNYYSHKEWQTINCNISVTLLLDSDKKEIYSIPTKSLYEAYLALGGTRMRIQDLVPFVGKKNAPAAAALLDNIGGNDMSLEDLYKLISSQFTRK